MGQAQNGSGPSTREQAAALDRQDPLRHMYAKFQLPPGRIYLDGNSLGALPKATPQRLQQVVVEEWGKDLIGSWNKNDWVAMTQRIGGKLSRLVGAQEHEVLACDTTSINLYKALSSCLQLQPGRSVIISERDNFPTDLYMVEGLIQMLGGQHRLHLVEDMSSIEEAITEEVAVIMLTQVNYRTGRLLDMRSITAAAHSKGVLVIWDLAHSAGALPIQLNDCKADFAVGCCYKYLNGGPGSPGFIFVAERHQGKVQQPLTGWFGHKAPFDFAKGYKPAGDIRQYLCSTPPVISLAALEVGVETMLEVSMQDVRRKSVQLTDLFIHLVQQQTAHLVLLEYKQSMGNINCWAESTDEVLQECGQHGFELQSPSDADQRGSQICLGHKGGYPIMQALIKRGVVGDYRPPTTLRFGFTPLYTRFVDVWDAVQHLKHIMDTNEWDTPEFWERNMVT